MCGTEEVVFVYYGSRDSFSANAAAPFRIIMMNYYY